MDGWKCQGPLPEKQNRISKWNQYLHIKPIKETHFYQRCDTLNWVAPYTTFSINANAALWQPQKSRTGIRSPAEWKFPFCPACSNIAFKVSGQRFLLNLPDRNNRRLHSWTNERKRERWKKLYSGCQKQRTSPGAAFRSKSFHNHWLTFRGHSLKYMEILSLNIRPFLVAH